MGFIQEFKEFAVKGNVMDLAVGVIIGGAFGKIIDSVVNDLVMPVVAAVIGQPDFSNLYLIIRKAEGVDNTVYKSLAEAREAGHTVFAYGNFITVLIQFLLLALVIFMMVKGINKLKKTEEPAPAPEEPSSTDKLLMEIRDSLKNK
ncbi:MAG TPA: large conductance mechanosensitive channel protein MscL [Edaphocola sp.]|nr:large conductance mechanosensitive channel protein MscL [Edaphocola sp.]